MEVHGVPEYVIVKGRVCVDNGKLNVTKGFGKFLDTPLNSPFVYNPTNEKPDKYQTKDIKEIVANVEKMAVEIPEIDPLPIGIAKLVNHK